MSSSTPTTVTTVNGTCLVELGDDLVTQEEADEYAADEREALGEDNQTGESHAHPAPPRKFQPGDRVRFTANGVVGTVTQNLGPRLNTRTGNDVIEWWAPGGLNLHDSSHLELMSS